MVSFLLLWHAFAFDLHKAFLCFYQRGFLLLVKQVMPIPVSVIGLKASPLFHAFHHYLKERALYFVD